jgi:chemotaxis protein MotB
MAAIGDTGDAPIIRIVRKKKGDGGHHGGAWKVAYADFVTAMMAFFLVMWIVGLDKPTRQAIEYYFNHPGLFPTSTGGKGPGANSNGIMPPVAPPKENPDAKQILEGKFKEAAGAIEKDLEKSPEFSGLKDSVQVRLTDEGLRIELLEKTHSMFFDSGSAALKASTVHLLRVIAKELGGLNNPIVIEGHTDSTPVAGKFGYSNWELSADRANAARRAMENNGLRPNQVLGVRGYADRKLLRPDQPSHFSNRRVSILVAYGSKEGQ